MTIEFSSMKIIELQALQYRWRGQAQNTLSIEQLTLEQGQHLFIRGPSGSGKTTLLNLLAGILLPTQGQLNILNQPLAHLSQAARDRFRADHLGIIFQQFNLLPHLSILDNVQLPCHFSARRRQRAGNLTTSTQHLFTALGLASTVQKRAVQQLSIGQQQRVAVARALIGNPELIIADEPTSALDADRRDDFMQLLFNQAQTQGSTIVLVSHDPALNKHFHQAIDLKEINKAEMSKGIAA